MHQNQRNLLVGVTVLGALLGMATLLLRFSGGATQVLRGGDQITVELRGDRADGLAEGSQVVYRGVSVGRITSIRRGSNSRDILIKALIENTPPLPGNVTGNIRTVSLVSGIALVSLDVIGGDTAPPTGTLTAGQEIPAIFVGSGLLPPEFTEDLKGVGAYVNDQKIHADLSASLDNIHHITDRLGAFSDRLDKIGDEATGTITDAHVVIKNAQGDVDHLSRQIDDRMLQVDKTLTEIQSVMGKVNNGPGTASLLVNDPKLYQSLLENSRALNSTILALKRLAEQWEQEGLGLKLK